MGINFRKRQLLREETLMNCESCHKVYGDDSNYCPECGNKLVPTKTKIYANYSKNGLTSITYVLPGNISINSRRGMTMSFGNGISYTSK